MTLIPIVGEDLERAVHALGLVQWVPIGTLERFVETGSKWDRRTGPLFRWAIGVDLLEEVVRRCRMCRCTDADCSGCIERTGQPCWWVGEDLCSACADLLNAAPARALPYLDALLGGAQLAHGWPALSVEALGGRDELREVRRLLAELARELEVPPS